jgi:hypothetical protein
LHRLDMPWWIRQARKVEKKPGKLRCAHEVHTNLTDSDVPTGSAGPGPPEDIMQAKSRMHNE